MLRTMCIDLSNNLMAISGCHLKKKRKKLYNPDNDDVYLKNYGNTSASPCKKKRSLFDNSNTHFENSSNSEQITECVERETLGESAIGVQQIRKNRKQSTKKNKEPISIEKSNLIDIIHRETNFDVQKLKDRHKKPINSIVEAYNFTEENNVIEIPNEDNQFAESFWDVKQVKKKRMKSIKNKDSVLNFTGETTVEVLNEGNNFGTSFSSAQKAKEKLKEFKNSMDEESHLTEKNSAVEDDNHQFIAESFFDVQQTHKKCKRSKKNKDMEPIFLDENNNSAKVLTREFSRESFSNTQKMKKKHKKSDENKAKKPIFTEVQNSASNEEIRSVDRISDVQQGKKKHKKSNKNEDKVQKTTDEKHVIKIASEENQSLFSFNGMKKIKRKHKKSKKNEDKEPLIMEERNVVEIGNQLRNTPLEGNQSVDTFCDVQLGQKKHKKSKKDEDKELKTTGENNVIKIANEQNQLVHSFIGVKKIKKKHKKSKKNDDKEPTIMEERNIVDIGNQLRNPLFVENRPVDTFCNVQKGTKKHKKSKKNDDRVQKTIHENNAVKIANKQYQSADSFCNVKKIKKKHKKSKKNEDKELYIVEERNLVEKGSKLTNLPIEENQSVDIFCDVQQAKKKPKKSKKNKNKEKQITEENNLKTVNEQNQSVDSLCNKQQMKKKNKKSERKINKKTLAESTEIPGVNPDTFYDLKQLKKNHKKSKRYKDKEPAFLVENSIADTLNEEHQSSDSFCNVQQLKKNYENNTSEEPTLLNKNNVFNTSSQNDKRILLEKYSLGNQMMKNIHKSRKSNLKATEQLSNMINQLQTISEIHDSNDPSNEENQNLNNNENVHSIDESLQETDPFDLDVYEEPVDFDIPPLHAFESVHSLTENQKNELLSQGVTIKTGRFTHEEDKILLKNFEKFAETHVSLNVCDIFGIGTSSSNPKIQQFLKATHFYVRLGNGLKDRTLSSIYKRARLLLHPYKNDDKLSQREVENVKHLRIALNKKWTYIGENIEQPADKCLQTYRWHEKSISRGKWTVEEEKELIAAMEKVIGSSDLSCDKVKKISWEKVATYVPSRNSSQCRMHWAGHLGWKSETERGKWNKSCNKKLVEILRKDWYVQDASKIDWFKVHEFFKNVSPSPINVQQKWLYLKTKIQDFKMMDYKTVLDELCNLYKVSVNETFSAPFSSSALNQRLSLSITNMRKSLENR